MPLQLTPPAVTGYASALPLEQLEQQLAELPLIHSSDAAHQLCLLFGQATDPALTLSARLLHFAGLQQAQQQLCELLQNEMLRRELSATLRAREAAQLMRALALHKLALIQCCLQQAVREAAVQQLVALLPASLGIALEALHVHMASYHPLPAGFWLDCHRIYQYAEQQGAADAVADQYKCLLLLGNIDSLRLSSAQISLLQQLAASETHSLQLEGESGGEPGDHPGAGYHLHNLQLVERLRMRLAQLVRGHSGNAGEEAELCQLLVHDLLRQNAPRAVRRTGGGRVELVSTLAACWYTLNGNSWQHPAGDDSDSELDFCLRLSRRSPPPPPLTMTVVNSSPCGMQLSGKALGHPLRAGEFVLIRQSGHDWQGALIRWVSYGAELDTRCGIELLGLQLDAVLVRPEPCAADMPSQLALGLGQQGQTQQLLLAGRLFQRLQRLRLARRKQTGYTRMLRVERQTPLYQLVACRQG